VFAQCSISRKADQTELFSFVEICINNMSGCLCHYLYYPAFISHVFALLYFHVPRCTIFVHISHKRRNFWWKSSFTCNCFTICYTNHVWNTSL